MKIPRNGGKDYKPTTLLVNRQFMPSYKFKKLDIVVIALIGVLIAFNWGLRAGFSWTGNTNTLSSGYMEVDNVNVTSGFYWNSVDRTDILAYPQQPASYIVWVDGSTYYAKNGTTGEKVLSNIDFYTLINTTASYSDCNHIHLMGGTYTLNQGLGRNDGYGGLQNNQLLTGEGQNTILTPKNQATTTISADPSIGESYVIVNDASDFTVGEWIEIEDGINTESFYVESIDSNNITLDSVFTLDFGIGDDVYSTWCLIDIQYKNWVTIRDLAINGNAANWNEDSLAGCNRMYEISGHGGYNHKIENVYIYNARRAAIRWLSVGRGGITGCEFDGPIVLQSQCQGSTVSMCTGYGTNAYIKAEQAYNVNIINNALHSGFISTSSITTPSYNVIIAHNQIYNVTRTDGSGIYGSGLINSQIHDNQIEVYSLSGSECGGLSLAECNDTIAHHNYIYTKSGGTITVSAIRIVNCWSLTVESNIVRGSWFGDRGIYAQGGDNPRIINNDLGTQTLQLYYGFCPTNTIIRGNKMWRFYTKDASDIIEFTNNYITDQVISFTGGPIGGHINDNINYVTENYGAQTCANNENIAHGLAGIPIWIDVTPMNDTYDSVPVIATVDWFNVDATNIQVGLYWVNGTAISDDVIFVSWNAKYEP